MIYWLVHIVIIVGLGWLLHNHFKEDFGPWMLPALVTKILASIALGLVYTYYYNGGDTWSLQDLLEEFNNRFAVDLNTYVSALTQSIDPYSGNPRTIFLIRLLSPLSLITGGIYWLLALYLGIFSFYCSGVLIRSLGTAFPQKKLLLILAFGFLPSLLFWSSGLSKDTMANSCFFFLTALVVNYFQNREMSKTHLIIGLLLFVVLFKIKHYAAGAFFFLTAYVIIDRYLLSRGIWIRLIAFATLVVAGGLGIRMFFIRLRPERFPITFYELNKAIKAQSSPEKVIPFDLEPTWASLVQNVPQSLAAGLFAPLPWNSHNLFSLFSSIENTIFLILSAITLRYAKLVNVNSPLVIACILFVILFASALPLATPNIGSLSRYRAIYLPFFLLLISSVPHQKWSDQSA